MESYRSGHNEPHSKCGRRVTGARGRIPHSPRADSSRPAHGAGLLLFPKAFGNADLHSAVLSGDYNSKRTANQGNRNDT